MASSAPVSANGSAKTEWLKRTNERYVRKRVTVGYRSSAHSSRIEPADVTGVDAADQIFFHIGHAGRDSDGKKLGALAGFDRTEFRGKVERFGAFQSRALADPR